MYSTKITKREKEVASLLVKGNTNSRIAEIINTSEHTVKAYLTSVIRKLDVKTMDELAERIDETVL